jgi:hypothetical protein
MPAPTRPFLMPAALIWCLPIYFMATSARFSLRAMMHLRRGDLPAAYQALLMMLLSALIYLGFLHALCNGDLRPVDWDVFFRGFPPGGPPGPDSGPGAPLFRRPAPHGRGARPMRGPGRGYPRPYHYQSGAGRARGLSVMSMLILFLCLGQFVSSRGNEYFCEIDEDYLTDRFNLTGLNTEVSYYQYALDLVTDVFDLDADDDLREQIEKSARHLYGLVHARYIVTTRGLAKMVWLS